MKKISLEEFVFIDYHSVTPKYHQLADSIVNAIAEGKVRKGDLLPSINELTYIYDISRETAEKGYKRLKKLGVLGSVPGKGYFVKDVDIRQQFKVFLLFNKLSAHKKIIYDAFAEGLGEAASIDFHIYNNDLSFFNKLIEGRRDDYTHYVIIPHFLEGSESAHKIINKIPCERLLLMDILLPGVLGNFSAVFEDFKNDIYHALEKALTPLSKYRTIKLIFPAYTYHPREIVEGFFQFCHQYAFTAKLVQDITNEPIREGDVFISLMENDLVLLIEKILCTRLKVGRHVGILSYNETPVKKIILDGITTISTDFQMMGEKAADLIKRNAKEHVAIPFKLTLRNSL